MTDRKTIHELIAAALAAQLDRLTAAPPNTATDWRQRAELIEHYESGAVYDRLDVELRADRRPNGRVDGRSLLAVVWMRTGYGALPLLAVRVRNLADGAGHPVDARQSTRDLLAQLEPIPDDPGGLLAPPSATDSAEQADPGVSDNPNVPNAAQALSAADAPVSVRNWVADPQAYVTYLRLVVFALTTLVRDPAAPVEQWLCCQGRGQRELSWPHEQAHALVEQLGREPATLASTRAKVLDLYHHVRAQGAA